MFTFIALQSDYIQLQRPADTSRDQQRALEISGDQQTSAETNTD